MADRSITLLELFSGTQSITKVFRAHGARTYTVDISDEFNPDRVADIMDLEVVDLPKEFQRPDVVWASPPCQAFSVAALGWNWIGEGRNVYPASDRAADALILLDKVAEILAQLAPTYWFIENPRGMMRHTDFIRGRPRRTITYCQYGDTSQKPTDIWTNCHAWTPLPPCNPIRVDTDEPCHVPSPRGSHAPGTVQGKSGAMARGVIPPALCEEIWEGVSGNGARSGQRTLGAFDG